MATTKTRSKSRAVAKQEPASLPDLYRPALIEIDAADLAMPRLKVGSGTSAQVQDGTAPLGSIYVATGKEDPDPQVLWEQDGGDGVLFTVLSLHKYRSLFEDGAGSRWEMDDDTAPEAAWVVYDYTFALPENSDLPVKMALTRSSTPVAKQINLLLAKQQATTPAYAIAFRMTTAKRTNPKGTWFVPRVVPAELTDSQIVQAATLAEMVASQPAPVAPTTSAPEI